MQSDRLQRLQRSKGSSYIQSPMPTQSKYLNNYAVSNTERRTILPPRQSITHSISPIRVVQISNDKIQPQLTQQYIQQPQEIHEIHHYERPLQVVTAEEMEQKYKFKLQQYEQIVYQLQVENQRLKLNVNCIPQPIQNNNNTKINELEQINQNIRQQDDKLKIEIKQLHEELQNWKDRYAQLQQQQNNQNTFSEELRQLKKQINSLKEDNEQLQQQMNQKDQEIIKLRTLLNEKDDEIDQLNEKIQELSVIEENYSRVETTVISLQGEVDVWRRKFKEKNEEASELSEKLIMAETSLEALKKRQITKDVQITKTTTNNNKIGATMTQSIEGGRFSTNRGSHHSRPQN